MLVLTRKVGESIVIADNIRVTVVSLGNGRVKVGIEAPHGVGVDRSEIHERKVAEAAAATPVTVGATDDVNDSKLVNRLTDHFQSQERPELRKPR